MSTWMRRRGWVDLFKGPRCDLLIALSALPCSHPGPLQLAMHDGRALVSYDADEDRLRLAVAAVDRLLDRCCDRFTDRPFKAPFELVARSESEHMYRQLIKRCLCFWRLWRLPRQVSCTLARRAPSKAQRRALESMWRDPTWEKPLAQASSVKVGVETG
ncbi:hypothetical protein Trco_007749 [Trichoderma cornu-damae]|uniref:Uncharacterized protein n=1 Tax=Trichoderma cornu-damae TaxID=654480 RepID=A0A9P8QKC1_9HYPO|nr:hypothetical protein Trco_007749 [Trichoderma cornu-damae]